MSLKHYVEFFYPGIVVSETTIKIIANRNTIESIELPKGCYGYRFFDQKEIELDGEILTGKKKNYSGMFYPGGCKMSLARIKKDYPHEKILISNMEINGWKYVIKTVVGTFQQPGKGDICGNAIVMP